MKYWAAVEKYFGHAYLCNLLAGKTDELVGVIIPLNGYPRYDPNLIENHI